MGIRQESRLEVILSGDKTQAYFSSDISVCQGALLGSCGIETDCA